MTKSDFSGFWVEEERKGDAIVSIGNVWKKGLLLGILLLLAAIIRNAKTRRVSVCNAVDWLIIDVNRLTDLSTLCSGLQQDNVEDVYKRQRQLLSEYLPPFRKAVKEGAGTLMTSYNAIDGVPCTANKELLTDGPWRARAAP